jgi:8-oxo-dGTP diphosphatase
MRLPTTAQSGTRGAAAALLLDDRGRVLVVKPTYKPGWGLPGGVIEELESPLTACHRELTEELGIIPIVESLAGVDWIPARLGRDPSIVFVFAGRVPGELVADIRLPPDELSDHRFIEMARLPDLLAEHIVRRLEACARAHRTGRTAYLEFGHEVIPLTGLVS